MSTDLPLISVHRITPRQGRLLWSAPDAAGLSAVSFSIPLEPFDSGLSYVPQPESTAILLYGFSLAAPDPLTACGRTFDLAGIEQGGSVCIGHRHNPVEVRQLALQHLVGLLYQIRLQLFIAFSFEGVGQDRSLALTATVQHTSILPENS